MSKRTKWIVLAALLAVLLIAAGVAYPKLAQKVQPAAPTDAADGTSDEAADPAPDFTVYDADGNEVKLSDFKGKPVIVNFWASWCPPCKAELPYFEAAYQQYGDKIEFLMVDLADGGTETQESGARYIAESGYTFPVYFDLSGSASNAYQLYSIPQTVAVDANGNITFSQIGSLPENTVMQLASGLAN